MSLLFVLFACGGGSSEDFASVFAAGGDFEPVSEGVELEQLGDVTVDVDDTYYCTETTYSRTEGRADQPVFNPSAGILYPGSLLQGEGVVDGVLQPIPLDRGPGDIVIDLVNGSTTPGVSVEQMSFKSVAEAMNTIVSETPDDLPARTRYSMKQVRSAEELAVAIGVDFETIGFALEGEFNYQESSEYNRFVVQLTQEYYTMVYDLPTTYDEVFAPEVTAEQLATYVQPGNPAAFVHSVTYGRMFYLLIQSTDTVQQISASIDASFSAAVSSGSVSADASYISELSELSIGGWAEGGDASLAGGALQGDVEALSAFIEDGGTITTGVPLSYVVRSVNRPDLILNVGRADEYTVEECVPMGQSLAGGVLSYDGDITETTYYSSLGVHALSRWPDQVPENGEDYDGLPPHLPYSGWVMDDAVNGRGDAVYFQTLNYDSDGYLRFPGSPFRDSDYSVFAVVMNPHRPDLDDEFHWFMWGPSSGENSGLNFGFEAQDVVVSHGGSHRFQVPADDDRAGEWFVYSFVFSEGEGLGIYQNGVLLGTDPSAEPLQSFNSASLGVADEDGYTYGDMRMPIANVQAYDFAVTETQRRFAEDMLMDRYGL